ncbi:TrkH family potassium uptake protein [Lacihabitans lacunae]|uniref:TrkH family potassium uptake protein n=1 Tax=Lacihabitans lacunae TaxID=1028214 RepID=A0ABV7YQ41_9BACT
MILFLSKWFIKFFIKRGKLILDRKYITDLIIFVLLFLFNVLKNLNDGFKSEWFLYILISVFFVIRFMAVSAQVKNTLLNPSLLFSISFIMLILGGTAMLLIPGATNGNLTFIDSLFTATSAVCVTGLSTVDVPSKFTDLGKDILIVLIQIGGLGLMTFTNFFAILFRGGMSLRNHLILSNLIETDKPNTLFSILKKILFYTVFIEVMGAVLIYLFTHTTYTTNAYDGWMFSFFHSISAFCNAGFSTVPDGLFNFKLRYNYSFQLVICFLIIFGGIGFPVVIDVYHSFKNFLNSALRTLFFGDRFGFQARNLTVHSQLVLSSTFILLVSGTLVYYGLEQDNVLREHPTTYGKLVQSFFGSVTPRTAGFNTVDISKLTQGTVLVYLLLMWIGAAPSSTGGGIKVTTFVMAISNVVALARGKDRVELFKREISQSSSLRAFAIIFLSLMILGISIFLVSVFNPTLPLDSIAFECFSAYGTVGLSKNLTGLLSDNSKIVLIVTMFLGRIGMFTVIFGLFKKVDCQSYRYPKESVQVL